MANNVKIQTYRGLRANLATLATTGAAGVLAWTTDSNELFVDSGTGTGIGSAWLPIANDIAVFSAASQAAMVALAAKVGDLALRTDNNLTYVLTAYPPTVAGNWTPVAVSSGTTIQGLGAPVAHEWVSYIDASGVQHLTQPAFTDISGQATAAQVPNLSALNGAITQTQLPASIGSGSSLTDIDCGTF